MEQLMRWVVTMKTVFPLGALAVCCMAYACADSSPSANDDRPAANANDGRPAADRGGIGKADLYGSCGDGCGAQGSGNCWCDSLCTGFGDCCADYEANCVDTSSSSAAGGGAGPDWIANCASASAPVEIVGAGSYETIVAAVTAAPPGATVRICPGTYNEQGIVIERDISVIRAAQCSSLVVQRDLHRLRSHNL